MESWGKASRIEYRDTINWVSMRNEGPEIARRYLSSCAISLVSRRAAVGGDEEGPGEIDF